jgi:galactose oxidase
MKKRVQFSKAWRPALLMLLAGLVAVLPLGQAVQSESKLPPAVAVPQTTPDPSVYGRWEAQQSLGTYTDTVTGETNRPVVPVHLNLLPNGKLLLWGRDREPVNGFDVHGYTHAFVLDSFYMSLKPVKNGRTNLFCSGHSFLPDGRLLVTGGHSTERGAAQEGHGSINTNIFDFRTDRWQGNPINPIGDVPPPDMNNGRWYPYNVTLDSGETMVASGSFIPVGSLASVQNDIAQIYGPDGTWRDVRGLGATYGNSHALRNYPFLHLLPNGQVYVAGASGSKETWFLNYSTISGEGEWSGGQWTSSPHQAGTSVQYEPGKIINMGGGTFGSQAINGYETIDLSGPTASLPAQTWTPLTAMGFPRVNHTGTLLPDGKVLVTGGSRCGGFNNHNCPGGPVLTPELWNGTNWQQMANHQVARGYHSVAILLPDGRVMIGGGGLPAAAGESPADGITCATGDTRAVCRKYGHNEVEIFSPPYLFLTDGTAAPRPSITHAPKDVTYGQNFTVGVGTVRANEVSDVVLVKLGAVTHGFNQDQRRIRLTATTASDLTLSVSAPADSKVCPPGHYMLFLMKQNGQQKTPSLATIIRVGNVSTAKSVEVFTATAQTREVNVSALTAAANWTVVESDPLGFITASRTPAAKLSITVTANSGERRVGQIRVRVAGQSVFDHVIDIYQGKNFTDTASVPSTHEAASKLNAVLITLGCTTTTYCPGDNLTREQLATMLVRAVHGPDSAPPSVSNETFADVPLGHWSHIFVEDIAKRGITQGCGTAPDGRPLFCPATFVTRAQLAVFLLRLLGIEAPPAPSNPTFEDISTHWARIYIEEAHKQGLMFGCAQSNMFCPEQPATRAEVAETLVRTLRL